ncbi:MAG TPA: LysM peptidoglycan-binding domain-containing protein [Planctomycetota bacterium]|nr:LysM peptidoglycan-binding domain-containing protein [Planctomycetota bacterium]
MTTKVKVAIAAVIVAAIGAVVGYDLMQAKNRATTAETAPRDESGLTLVRETSNAGTPAPETPANAAAVIGEADRRETGPAGAPPTQPDRTAAPAPVPAPLPVDPHPATEEYVVQAGETLAAIAEKKYGDQNKWTIIAKANPTVNPNKMKVGAKLVLPSPAATPNPAPEAAAAKAEPDPAPADGSPRTYTIQVGDSLSKIAKRFYGTTTAVAKIKEANVEALQDVDFLAVGLKLVLPEMPAKAPPTVTKGEPGTNHTTEKVDPQTPTGRTHTVARGESLWKIADKYHGGLGVLAFMDKLVAANPDKLSSKNTPLHVGWALAIPNIE